MYVSDIGECIYSYNFRHSANDSFCVCLCPNHLSVTVKNYQEFGKNFVLQKITYAITNLCKFSVIACSIPQTIF